MFCGCAQYIVVMVDFTTQNRYNTVANGYFDKKGVGGNLLAWDVNNLTATDKPEYTLLDNSHPSYLGRYVMKFDGISLLISTLDSKKKELADKEKELALIKSQKENDDEKFVDMLLNLKDKQNSGV